MVAHPVNGPTAFPHLLSPLEHGRVRMRNRVMQSAHMTLYSRDGVVGDRLIRYYAERARGGAGMIVSEATAVHPTTVKFPQIIKSYDPANVPWFNALADAVHEHDARMVVQFAHGGSRMSALDSSLPLYAPSATVSVQYNETPRAMTLAELTSIQDGYLASAANVSKSRLDGLEIHAAHGYLPQQFLSPRYNQREDAYGGSVENRFRFLREILEGCREVLRDDQLLGLKLNGSDLEEGGLNVDDYVEVAQAVEALAAVDYITVSVGTSTSNHKVVPAMPVDEGFNVANAVRIRQAVSLPVFPVGRIYRPEYAESLLADGTVDGVALARAFIADPDWVRKAATQPERIRPCIAVNQGCFGYLHRSRPITCAVNPQAGKEADLRTTATDEPQRVAVVGGGPAGMEAAVTAATRGHQVTLFEASEHLGGMLRLASCVPSRHGWHDLLDFYDRELEATHVDVQLGTRIESGSLVTKSFDTVVVAIGSTFRKLDPGPEGSPTVLTVGDSLALDSLPADSRIVLVDHVGTMEAYVPAEHLRSLGSEVLVVTPHASIGGNLDIASFVSLMERFGEMGIAHRTTTACTRTEVAGVVLRDVYLGSEQREPCTHVVHVVARQSAERSIAKDLKDAGVRTIEVGDCVAPRSSLEAIREGQRAGQAL